MKLNHALLFIPEQILHKTHFLPIRRPATVSHHRDVFPSVSRVACHREIAAGWSAYKEYSNRAVFRRCGVYPPSNAAKLKLFRQLRSQCNVCPSELVTSSKLKRASRAS
jgi:hypothetical protein